jgi:hypothetical protein
VVTKDCVVRELHSSPRRRQSRAPPGTPRRALSQLAWAHLKAVGATRTQERLHRAAESREAYNPKIVVRYGMEGRARLVDVGRPERNSRPSERKVLG